MGIQIKPLSHYTLSPSSHGTGFVMGEKQIIKKNVYIKYEEVMKTMKENELG